MKRQLKVFNIILAAVNGIILAVFAVSCARAAYLENEFGASAAKDMWDSKQQKYSQISLFFRHDSGIDTDGYYQLKQGIEEKLKESGVNQEETGGRLWIDCASTDSALSLELTASMGTCSAAVTGTYGDYFIFHPEKLLYGSYYTEDDTNLDRIVIDKDCSWQLFGSVETTGLPVRIGNRVMYVAAVVDTPDDETALTAYGKTPRIYMPYETLKGFDSSVTLTSYEACIPEIMKNYAYNLMTEINPVSEERSIITDQTNRFGIIDLFNGYKKIPENVMITSGISFPWFENAVRSGEIRAQMIVGPTIYPLIITAFSLVYLIFMLTKLGGSLVNKIKDGIEKRRQKRISEIYFKERSKKE